jgi:DNA-binding MarR family transcriptional regulator
LSKAGQDLVEQLRPEWRRREAIIQAGLSKAEQTVLVDLLDRLLTASEKLRADEAEQLEAAERKAPVRARAANGRSYRRGGTEVARGI